LECWQTSAYSFYRQVRGTLRLGLTVAKSGLFAVKSNNSIELSTGCRESFGASLAFPSALPSSRTQVFDLYRYFTHRAFGSDYQ
jgi:hypothetical protein